MQQTPNFSGVVDKQGTGIKRRGAKHEQKRDFAQYKKALDGASPTVKEALLQRADQVDHLPMEEILELVRLAYPDRDIC